ncbi:MAG: hypothetical protein ISP55_06310 [Flavobacteriales bacterium]|nr:hypothetical protein [Flavobacteriales bacterium]
MIRSGAALFGFCACLLVILSSGCSSNKRLGESRVEARRYSKGWHVNNAGPSSRDLKQHQAVPLEEPTVPAPASVLVEGGSDVLAAAEDMALTENQSMWSSPASSVFETGEDDGHGFFTEDGPLQAHSASPSSLALPDEVGRLFAPFNGSEPEMTGRPEPVAGRHPDAVLGFIMSLGWLMGLIASTVLDGLGVSNPGSAFGLGLLLSLAGYFLSRSAFRASKANPERYPRSGLSSSARWVAGFPVLLALVYLVVVVVVYVLFLGFLFGSF